MSSYHWSNAGCGHASSCLPSTGLGAVRCCGAPLHQDRRRCLSVCDPRTLLGPTASPWSHTEMTPRTALLDGVHVTHAGAATECEARGLRLCSRAELQQCCKMGCGLDKQHLTCRNQGSSDSASWLARGSCPRQLMPRVAQSSGQPRTISWLAIPALLPHRHPTLWTSEPCDRQECTERCTAHEGAQCAG